MFVGLSVGINRVAAKAGLEPGDLRRILRLSLTTTGTLDVERFLSASESINLTTSAALTVLRELSASPLFSLTAAGTLDAASPLAIQQRDGAYILDRAGNYIEVRA